MYSKKQQTKPIVHHSHTQNNPMTPLEKVEALYDELVSHYGEGEDREIRAAAKLLLVALAKFKKHGGPRGIMLADEYLDLIKHDPEKFERIVLGNRSDGVGHWIA